MCMNVPVYMPMTCIYTLDTGVNALPNVYHHTLMNTPVLVRSRKLSIGGPG